VRKRVNLWKTKSHEYEKSQVRL